MFKEQRQKKVRMIFSGCDETVHGPPGGHVYSPRENIIKGKSNAFQYLGKYYFNFLWSSWKRWMIRYRARLILPMWYSPGLPYWLGAQLQNLRFQGYLILSDHEVHATRAKFLESSVYCSVINCVFFFQWFSLFPQRHGPVRTRIT